MDIPSNGHPPIPDKPEQFPKRIIPPELTEEDHPKIRRIAEQERKLREHYQRGWR